MKNTLAANLELFDFFQLTPDLVCIAGKDGFFKKVNTAVINKLGYTAEELYARPIESFIHDEDRVITSGNRQQLLSGKTLLNFVNRYVTKNNEVIWLEWTSIYYMEKEVVFAIAKDVTERKLIEKEVDEKYKKFKSLATHFKNSIEKDRKYLAYELHEELAQLISAVRMDIDMIAHHVTEGLPKSTIEHAQAVSALLIKSIQRISFSISPKMMEDFGLDITMEWLCKEFSILNNIPCHFESAYDEAMLTEEIKTDFFRICQEALMNVADYANAGKVTVSIKEIDDNIQLMILDDGKGFDMNQTIRTPGLINMRHRTSSINGQFTIESKTGEGTKILVTVTKYQEEA